MAKIVTGIIIAAVIVIGALAIFNQSGTGGEVIKIGVIEPLTGDEASYGESETRAMQIAVDEINAAGGIGGKTVELIIEDGKCDPLSGGTAAQKLIAIDGVKIIVGGACVGETIAAAAVTEPAKVILISPSASSPKVSTIGDFVFRTYPSDALAGRIAAKYSYGELKAKKAALLTELTDYAKGLREVYREAFKEFGGTIVEDQTYTTGDTDFRTQVLKIKAAKPDVIYIVPQTNTPGLAIVKQLRENNVKAQIVTAEVLLDRQVAKENAAALEGVIGVEPAIDWEGNPKAEAFREAHRAKFDGADPGAFAANSYDAVYLIKEAIEATGVEAIDTIKMRDWLYGVKDWAGAVGSFTFDENGDPVMGENVRKIVDGEVTDLGPYAP